MMNKNETAVYLNKASDLVIQYGINGVSVIGALFNFATLIVLATNYFDHRFYNFLRCRCICNLAVCSVGIFYYDLTNINVTVEYLPLYYQWLVIRLPMRLFFSASIVSDNLIILNRLAVLYKKHDSIFYTLSKKVNYYENKSPFDLVLHLNIYCNLGKSFHMPYNTNSFRTAFFFCHSSDFKLSD